jgi:predicted N-acetyltransferase YhbS
MNIRKANERDIDSITEVVSLAFNEERYLQGGRVIEATLVRELINDNDDIVNLVAEDSEIVGHVFVSTVSVTPDARLSCGQVSPLSVHPDHQSRGIGSSLMRAVVDESKANGLDVLFLLGDPNYYRRFGFVPSNVDNVYRKTGHFQQLEINAGCIESRQTYAHLAPAFSRLGV